MVTTQSPCGRRIGVIKIEGILTKKSLGGQKRNKQRNKVKDREKEPEVS
jgi:hypothetical protein